MILLKCSEAILDLMKNIRFRHHQGCDDTIEMLRSNSGSDEEYTLQTPTRCDDTIEMLRSNSGSDEYMLQTPTRCDDTI